MCWIASGHQTSLLIGFCTYNNLKKAYQLLSLYFQLFLHSAELIYLCRGPYLLVHPRHLPQSFPILPFLSGLFFALYSKDGSHAQRKELCSVTCVFVAGPAKLFPDMVYRYGSEKYVGDVQIQL